MDSRQNGKTERQKRFAFTLRAKQDQVHEMIGRNAFRLGDATEFAKDRH